MPVNLSGLIPGCDFLHLLHSLQKLDFSIRVCCWCSRYIIKYGQKNTSYDTNEQDAYPQHTTRFAVQSPLRENNFGKKDYQTISHALRIVRLLDGLTTLRIQYWPSLLPYIFSNKMNFSSILCSSTTNAAKH